MVLMVGVVVGRQEFAEQPLPPQATGESIQQRRVLAAAIGQAALVVALHAGNAGLGAHVVHVDRQPVSVQAEAALLAGAIDVGAGKARARDAQRDELGTHAIQGQGHAAVDDIGPPCDQNVTPPRGPRTRTGVSTPRSLGNLSKRTPRSRNRSTQSSPPGIKESEGRGGRLAVVIGSVFDSESARSPGFMRSSLSRVRGGQA
jgi:hypothetical protein